MHDSITLNSLNASHVIHDMTMNTECAFLQSSATVGSVIGLS